MSMLEATTLLGLVFWVIVAVALIALYVRIWRYTAPENRRNAHCHECQQATSDAESSPDLVR